MMLKNRTNINNAMVFKIIGLLLVIESTFMLLPLVVSILYNEWETTKCFLYSALITAGIGSLLTICIKPERTNMYRKDGFLLTTLVWALFSAFGMLPFLFSGTIPNVADAYFETISGFTTTGATICPDVEWFPKGILFWRALMQWVGGMGIIIFTLAVVPMVNQTGGMELFNAEVTGITHEKLRPRVSQSAKSLWGVYIVLTLLMIFFLSLGPMDLFDSICHTFTALSTGGFSTRNGSIGDWNSTYTNVVVIIFMFLGGVCFTLLYNVYKEDNKLKVITKNTVLRWYVLIFLFSTIACYIYLVVKNPNNLNFNTFVESAFQIISGFTSTGYSIADFESWGPFPVVIISLLMISCACAGSTTGGVKLDRIVVLMKSIKNEFVHVIHPNLVTVIRLDKNIVPNIVVQKTMAFLGIYALLIIFNIIVISLFGIELFDAIFMSLSAVGNVGYGYGVTHGGVYSALPDAIKWLLSFDMLAGRLELFTVLIIFTKGFWIKGLG